MTTPTQFRQKVRDAIADNAPSGVLEFTDKVLDGWRDDELGLLYSRGLFVRSSTRTLAGWVEPTVASTTAANGSSYVNRYYTLPAAFRRVLSLEAIDLNTDGVVWTFSNWTDLEETGLIRIDDIEPAIGYKLRYFGEREYTAVDDTALKAEVIHVLKLGVVLQAMTSELVRRTKAARSQVATRTTDASPGAIAASIGTVERLHRIAIKDALRIQALSTISTRG
jgi:hypothetical protein